MKKEIIVKAYKVAFPLADNMDVDAWSRAIQGTLTQCRDRKKSMTTGRSMGACTFKLCKFLQGHEKQEQPRASPLKEHEVPPKEHESKKNKADDRNPMPGYKRAMTTDEVARLCGFVLASSSSSSASPYVPRAVHESPMSIASSPGGPEMPQKEPPLSPGMEQFLWSKSTMVRYGGGRILEEAKMEEGPAGFAVARWRDGCATASEVTNLMLERMQTATMKKPAAAPAALKRPAANWQLDKDAEIEEDEEEADEEAEEEANEEAEEKANEEAEEKAIEEAEEEAMAEDPVVALKIYSNFKFQSTAFGDCKVEFYSRKGYIRRWELDKNGPGQHGWTSVVNVEIKGDSRNLHKEVLSRLVEHAKERGQTKDGLIAKRAEIIRDFEEGVDEN